MTDERFAEMIDRDIREQLGRLPYQPPPLGGDPEFNRRMLNAQRMREKERQSLAGRVMQRIVIDEAAKLYV